MLLNTPVKSGGYSIACHRNFSSWLRRQYGLWLVVFLWLCVPLLGVQAAEVMLAWDANTESNLGGYYLHYGQNSGNYSAKVDVGNQTSYTLSGLTDGNTYYLATTAYDNTGTQESGFSNEVSKSFDSLPPPSADLPAPWQSADIGNVGKVGGAGYNNGTFTVNGAGSDIWNSNDAFRYVYQPLSGNGTIVARVASIENTNSWAKAGVMIRERLDPDARHAMAVVTPRNGVNFQRRRATGGGSSSTAGDNANAPYWVKLVRAGNTFTAYQSANGSDWSQIGSDTVNMATDVYVGLVLTSHDNNQLNTSTFKNVEVSSNSNGTALAADFNTDLTSGTAPLEVSFNDNSTGTVTDWYWDFGDGATSTKTNPTHTYITAGTYTVRLTASGSNGSDTEIRTDLVNVSKANSWLNMDIGNVGIVGSAENVNGTFTVKGAGKDIWGNVDAFHYLYQPLSGDGTIVARVASIENTDSWAKAGVMIRESLDANARHAMAVVTARQGVSFQRRLVTGGSSYHTTDGTASAPYWVKLERTGNTFKAYQSADGSAWSVLGSDTVGMATDVYVGLAVTAHNNSALNTATLDQVLLTK